MTPVLLSEFGPGVGAYQIDEIVPRKSRNWPNARKTLDAREGDAYACNPGGVSLALPLDVAVQLGMKRSRRKRSQPKTRGLRLKDHREYMAPTVKEAQDHVSSETVELLLFGIHGQRSQPRQLPETDRGQRTLDLAVGEECQGNRWVCSQNGSQALGEPDFAGTESGKTECELGRMPPRL